MNRGAVAVSVSGVSKTYRRGPRSVLALEDISLQIEEGEFVVVTGPSGAGKTTLLNLLAALDAPDRGEIVVWDTPLSGLADRAAARFRNERIGVVFQAYNLLPQLTALENVILPMIPSRRVDRARAEALLGSVGLRDRSSHRAIELSGGEQQRVALARALANDPPLLLADEPMGNLDDDAASAVLELLAEAHARGRTLILATHDGGPLRRADRVIELRMGRLTGSPTHGNDQGPRHLDRGDRQHDVQGGGW